MDPADLTDLPTLDGWAAQLDPDGQHMRIVEPSGTFYDGDLGAAADRGERIDDAAASGGVVGAQLPVVVTPLDTR